MSGKGSGSGQSGSGGYHYAVAKGRMPGIYQKWEQCESQVKGFSDAKFKKFETMQQAQDFVVSHGAEQVLRDKLTREVEQRSSKQ